MNVSGFDDDDNVTFVDSSQTFERFDANYTGRRQALDDFTEIDYVVGCIAIGLGVPGNILSAIVWLRRQIADKNSSAIYLAALAINDLAYLAFFVLSALLQIFNCCRILEICSECIRLSAAYLEALLVLGFSVERLIAILCPVKARVVRTIGRSQKVIVCLTLVAMTAALINDLCYYLSHDDTVHTINGFAFYAVVPLTVLIINLVVVHKVCRASNNVTSNIGLRHSESTSINLAVPTVMLVVTSLVYVLLRCTWGLFYVLVKWAALRDATYDVVSECLDVSSSIARLTYAYNFYVYLITGKRFRSELRKLLCHSSVSSSAAASAAADAPAAVAVAGHEETELN